MSKMWREFFPRFRQLGRTIHLWPRQATFVLWMIRWDSSEQSPGICVLLNVSWDLVGGDKHEVIWATKISFLGVKTILKISNTKIRHKKAHTDFSWRAHFRGLSNISALVSSKTVPEHIREFLIGCIGRPNPAGVRTALPAYSHSTFPLL